MKDILSKLKNVLFPPSILLQVLAFITFAFVVIMVAGIAKFGLSWAGKSIAALAAAPWIPWAGFSASIILGLALYVFVAIRR